MVAHQFTTFFWSGSRRKKKYSFSYFFSNWRRLIDQEQHYQQS